MIIGSTPWWLALATAIWFGLMARRAGRSPVLWSISGGLFALVVATLILGLGQAMTIPFSDADRSVARTEWTVAVVIIVAVLGLLFTLGLYRKDLGFGRPASTAPSPVTAKK